MSRRVARTPQWERSQWYLPPRSNKNIPVPEVGAWFRALGAWFLKISALAVVFGFVMGVVF